MLLPLWRILLKLGRPDTTLTCDECFVLLEYLADERVQGADLKVLYQAARQHLSHCPGCREHHLERMRELEARFGR